MATQNQSVGVAECCRGEKSKCLLSHVNAVIIVTIMIDMKSGLPIVESIDQGGWKLPLKMIGRLLLTIIVIGKPHSAHVGKRNLITQCPKIGHVVLV
jgi:hypothetical protein